MPTISTFIPWNASFHYYHLQRGAAGNNKEDTKIPTNRPTDFQYTEFVERNFEGLDVSMFVFFKCQ
jgi:hypothetical protein